MYNSKYKYIKVWVSETNNGFIGIIYWQIEGESDDLIHSTVTKEWKRDKTAWRKASEVREKMWKDAGVNFSQERW